MGSAYGWVRMVAATALAVVALAGCGSDAPTRAVATPSATPVAQGAKQTGAAAVALVNDVCRALRTDAPAPVPNHPSAGALTAYVNAASPTAERMVVSLQRLAGSYRVTGLDRVVSAYTGLRATYASAATQRLATSDAARMIVSQEGAVSSAARAAQLPACAVGTR